MATVSGILGPSSCTRGQWKIFFLQNKKKEMKGRSEGWKMEEGKMKRKEERIKNKEKRKKEKMHK